MRVVQVDAAIQLSKRAGRGGVSDVAAWLNRSTLGYAEAARDSQQRGNRSHVAPRGLGEHACVSLHLPHISHAWAGKHACDLTVSPTHLPCVG